MQVFFFNHPHKITLYGLNISLVKKNFLIYSMKFGVKLEKIRVQEL